MIEAAVQGGHLRLTINRPDRANALTEAMLNALTDHIEQADAPVLVLTGVGGVFSAGADLDEVKHGTLATSPAWERLSSAVARFPGLSVAALNGPCAGGALGMVLACDIRLAVPSARFFYPVIKMGVLPQPSDPGRLSSLVGASMAKRILLTGARLSASDALSAGLVDLVCEDSLEEQILNLIEPALSAPVEQVTAIKAMIDG